MITAIKDLKHIRIIITPAPGWLKQTGNEMGINVFLLNVNGTRFSTGSLRHNNCAPAERGREQRAALLAPIISEFKFKLILAGMAANKQLPAPGHGLCDRICNVTENDPWWARIKYESSVK